MAKRDALPWHDARFGDRIFVFQSDEKVDRSDRSFRAVAQTRLIGKSNIRAMNARVSERPTSDRACEVRAGAHRASAKTQLLSNDVDDDGAFQTYDARFRVSRGRPSRPHARLAQCPTSRTHR